MAKEALEAGKHVACEKPLATTVEEARELVELGRAKGIAQLRLPQSALLPHGAAVAPHERGRRAGRDPLRAGRDIRRTGCSTIRTGTGASTRKPAAHRAAWPTSARTGSTWPSTSPACASLRWSPILQTFHATRKQPKHSVESFANKLLGPEDYIETRRRYGRLRRGALSHGRARARQRRCQPGLRGAQEPAAHRGLRQQKPGRHGIRNGPMNSGSATAMRATKSSSKIRRCSSPRRAATPTCLAATRKATTIHQADVAPLLCLDRRARRRSRISAVRRRVAATYDPQGRAGEPSDTTAGSIFSHSKDERQFYNEYSISISGNIQLTLVLMLLTFSRIFAGSTVLKANIPK